MVVIDSDVVCFRVVCGSNGVKWLLY
jgi:hypothetical protein